MPGASPRLPTSHDKELRFDPRKLSRQDAANRLAQRKGKWNGVWNCFASSTGYEGIVQLLSAEEPSDLLADKAPFPKVNAQEEKALREALTKMGDMSRPPRRQCESRPWRRLTLGDATLSGVAEERRR